MTHRAQVVLLHGSVTNAPLSWGKQRTLREEFDVLREPGAERIAVPGAGHAVQNAPAFTEELVAFLRRAA